jgi:hypothetical protein
MPHERTDPVQTPPPPVGSWNIIFTRRVAAGTSKDSGYVDTGLVYDNSYEYYIAAKMIAKPSPAVSGPTVAVAIFSGADTAKGNYKPDGSTSIAITGSAGLYIPAQQDLSSLASGTANTFDTPAGDGSVAMRVDAAGKFYSKWLKDSGDDYDGQFMLARRLRYG